jgi:hypothetical protein
MCNPEGWVIWIFIEADDLRRAWLAALHSAFEAALVSGLPLWSLISVAVMDGQYAAAKGLPPSY